jgi:hypothetical protein
MAAHVASPGTRLEISFSGNNSGRPAAVIGRNITLDLALIRADHFPEDPVGLTIFPVTPDVGSQAFVHGYPASRMSDSTLALNSNFALSIEITTSAVSVPSFPSTVVMAQQMKKCVLKVKITTFHLHQRFALHLPSLH